jgi:hypothetical protein
MQGTSTDMKVKAEGANSKRTKMKQKGDKTNASQNGSTTNPPQQ